jgi:CheY-like chemotaxis protein
MAKKIMIVDDDPNIVSYLQEVFEDEGYETCTASDGSEAMEVVEQEKPDLITLDLEMPDEWGPKFYRNLSKSEKYKHLPVIVISGLSGNRYAIPKAVASFSKPFDRTGLLRAVKENIGE